MTQIRKPIPPSAPSPGEDPQVALMLRVKAGDANAFEELVRLHRAKVVFTVAKMIHCRMEAEDIAQKVFIQVWKSAHRYEPRAKFETWLFTIARNLVFNEQRRRKRKPLVSIDEQIEMFYQTAVDSRSISPDRSTLFAELETKIDEAISELPESQRSVFRLRFSHAMSYEQISNQLDITISSVKGQLFRARSQLRGRLGEYFESRDSSV